jgi:hypothetical protein
MDMVGLGVALGLAAVVAVGAAATMNVPFIRLGWISQWKWYVPAFMLGTAYTVLFGPATMSPWKRVSVEVCDGRMATL